MLEKNPHYGASATKQDKLWTKTLIQFLLIKTSIQYNAHSEPTLATTDLQTILF